MIAKGNVVRHDNVLFFLDKALGTQVGTQAYLINDVISESQSCYWSKSAVDRVPEVSIALSIEFHKEVNETRSALRR
jgi:hypothetical protein